MLSYNPILNYFVAMVWIVNGLFCKVLGLVPRHQMIVARILGNDHSRTLTILIGVAETGLALWIVSQIRIRLAATIQITTIAMMNILEFILAPDLLLWGKLNALFAFLFILLVYYNGLHLSKKIQYT